MVRNKKKSLVITAFLALLVLITGTFAWTSFSQRALNEVNGGDDEPAGGRIHDDYNKASGNKDIYAENYGEEDLLVRMKLSEYLELDGTPLVSGTTKAERNSWTPYVLPETTAPTNDYRSYVTWTLGGEKNFLPTFNTNKDDLSTDAAGDAIDFIVNGKTALGDGSQDFFKTGEVITNPDDSTQKHAVKKTLTQSKAPISMAAWKALPANEKNGDFWVIDTDGWAYWANKLKPTESTSLVLDQIKVKDSIDGTWYYGIDVLGEFVNEADKDEFANSEHGAPSKDGEDLINSITKDEEEEEQFTYNVEFTTDVENIEMNVNKETSRQFAAKVVKTDKDGIKSDVATALTWSITPDEFASVDNTGLVTVKELAEATTLKVTAKSAEFDVENSFDILAKPALKAGEEFDFYGEQYIDLKDLGDGNHLVLRKFLLPADKNSSTSVAYNGGNLDQTLKAYYAGLKPEAQAVVQPVQKTFTLGMGDSSAFGLDAQNFLMSSPAPDYAKVTSNGGEKKAFALSAAELTDVSGKDKVFPTAKSRGAAHEATPASTFYWWLRTPYSSTDVWNVNNDSLAGQFDHYDPSVAFGVRPALIIHL
ncbi:conserved exported hypothetical protein [Carnobacterium maltaromaticum]|uniref:DUF6273 domain-containing protein n=1 Tax=Carnobacterium maltaromaticum TaxID=2751 RepID=UPI00191BA9FF|nr:DUF6273 domain-containing protein [Carnobacterium maltaromaticum]CAD5896357.1 conserved exported hypothetical protein [Carnobacterium maltaromaticum]